MKKTLLLIDGSYIGHRSLFALGKQMQQEITLDTNEEMRLFEQQLVNDVISIYKSININTRVDNILFYVDKNSWRNSETMHRPYYEPETKLIGYKENRKEKKDSSNVDWLMYHECLANACHKLNTYKGIFGLTREGFEADDLIFLTTNHYHKIHNILIFANDGDYQQCVLSPNVYYIKNSKSKDCPTGAIVVDKKYMLKREIANIGGLEILKNKMAKSSGLLDIISKIEIGKHEPGQVLRNENNNGIVLAEPFYFGFLKAISGDKKDNILPIIGKYSESGRLTRVLEKNVLTAFSTIRESISDDGFDVNYNNKTNNELAEIIVDDIRNSDTAKEISGITKTFLLSLVAQLKQSSIAKNIFQHLKLNIKIMMLTQLIYNKSVTSKFESILQSIEIKLNEKIDLDNDNTETISGNNSINSVNDILFNSIPESN